MIRLTTAKSFWRVAAFAGLLIGASQSHAADDATLKLYQAKCSACHGADGSGNTTVGKALKLADIRSPEAQKMSDADIATLIAKGKDKMPANEKTLKPEQIKSLAGYVRELAQKK
jgi:mono/diheme cytochrome c family protein